MRRRRQKGLTLIELIVAFTILSLLSAMSVPLARYKVRRDRERQLNYALREIRAAIDKYKDASDQKLLGPEPDRTNGQRPPPIRTPTGPLPPLLPWTPAGL